jgi:hypothetical protein
VFEKDGTWSCSYLGGQWGGFAQVDRGLIWLSFGFIRSTSRIKWGEFLFDVAGSQNVIRNQRLKGSKAVFSGA